MWDTPEWGEIVNHMEQQLHRDTVHHVIQSCGMSDTLDYFVKNECDGKPEILDLIISFLVHKDRLLFLTPPSMFNNTRRQVILSPSECITIRFVLNASIEVIGAKILGIDPASKQHWRVAELFGIPIQNSRDSQAICKLYNIRGNRPNKMSKEKQKKQARLSIPKGVAAESEDIDDLHKSLKEAFHENRDGESSVGLFWRKPVILLENVLYCLRIKLTAFEENNVFVTRWYDNKFREKPITNYRRGMFRSLHFDVPEKMDFVPHVAIMKNHNQVLELNEK